MIMRTDEPKKPDEKKPAKPLDPGKMTEREARLTAYAIDLKLGLKGSIEVCKNTLDILEKKVLTPTAIDILKKNISSLGIGMSHIATSGFGGLQSFKKCMEIREKIREKFKF